MERAGETPYPSRAQPDRIFEIAIHLRQSRPDIPGLENGPFLLNQRVPV
jgi:hypothetical protein